MNVKRCYPCKEQDESQDTNPFRKDKLQNLQVDVSFYFSYFEHNLNTHVKTLKRG